jgi:hypothetical protein
MCKGDTYGDVEQRTTLAGSKRLISPLAISSFSGSRWRAYAKTGRGVSARVYVVLHSMGRIGRHIICVEH